MDALEKSLQEILRRSEEDKSESNYDSIDHQSQSKSKRPKFTLQDTEIANLSQWIDEEYSPADLKKNSGNIAIMNGGLK